MNITILCKTKIKDSLSEEGIRWYKEYGVFSELTNDEVDHYASSPFGMKELYKWSSPVITVSRRVILKGEKQSFSEWVLYDGFENVKSAAMGFGDSDYWFNAESINPIHAQAVEKNNKINSLKDEYTKLEDGIKDTWLRHSTKLKDKYNDLYESELKSKRLFSKAKNGTAPQNVIDDITVKLKAKYDKELSGIEARMDEIKTELSEV